MGPAVGTQVISAAFRAAGIEMIHVNTWDQRTVFNVGVLDFRNVRLGLLHATEMAWKAFRHPVRLVYVPISQSRWGYARDGLLIVIARSLRRPVVVHLHGANLQEFFRASTRLERSLIRRTLRSVVLAIALTPSLRTVYTGLVPPDRVRVLENAIPDPWPKGIAHLLEARNKRASSGGELRLLFIANDFATKGAGVAAEALTTPGLQKAVLRMIGAPPSEVVRPLEQQAERLGVRGRLELLGGLVDDDKLRQYEWADIFVYPTENDAQPMVVLEAMAAGLPIVTTTQGGILDTVADTAVVVERGNPSDFRQALADLAANPDERQRLGAAARIRFLARYTPEHFQLRFEAVFSDLLSSVEGDRAAS